MQPTYVDLPPFEWTEFYTEMAALRGALQDVGKALNVWRRTARRAVSRATTETGGGTPRSERSRRERAPA